MLENVIIILAAGASSRLGKPKQLLKYGESNLLNHTINTCLESEIGKVIVVLGAFYEDIFPTINAPGCKVVVNKDWAEGLGNSIAFGISAINNEDVDNIILVLADQPFLKPIILKDLVICKEKTNALIVNCTYKDGSGPPVLFDKTLIPELSKLAGDTGARGLTLKYKADVESVLFEKGHLDIDREQDLNLLHGTF